MRLLRFLARLVGWLLTPLVASAASFFGAIAGAVIATRMADPVHGLIVSAVCALAAAVLVATLWLRVLRKSPEVREVLGVDETGVPETFLPEEPPAPPESENLS